MFKILMILLFLAILICLLFFFWVTSSNLSKQDAATLSNHNFEQKIKSDSIHSIVTYNIGHLSGLYTDTSDRSKTFYQDNFNKASDLFGSINPDIIAFQDIDFDSKRSYNTNQSYQFSELGYNHVADAVYWDKKHILSPYWPIPKQTGKIIAGQAVLSKFLIKEQKRIVLENDVPLPFYKKKFYQDRIAQIVELTINDKPIIIINVHLEDASKSVRTTQFNYVLEVFKKYAANYPTFLLGDFNSSINKSDAVIKQLFEMPTIGYSKYKNLDHIFFTKNSIEIVNSSVLNEFDGIANHTPLLMEFKLK